jgi:hypothetical protein
MFNQGSEVPERRALADYVLSIEHNLLTYISLHAYSQVWTYPCTPHVTVFAIHNQLSIMFAFMPPTPGHLFSTQPCTRFHVKHAFAAHRTRLACECDMCVCCRNRVNICSVVRLSKQRTPSLLSTGENTRMTRLNRQYVRSSSGCREYCVWAHV